MSVIANVGSVAYTPYWVPFALALRVAVSGFSFHRFSGCILPGVNKAGGDFVFGQ